MVKKSFPLKNSVLKTESYIDQHGNLNTPDDCSIGHILEVDLHYPKSLHSFHSTFPLAQLK